MCQVYRFFADDSGHAIVEYALVLALILCVLLGVVRGVMNSSLFG